MSDSDKNMKPNKLLDFNYVKPRDMENKLDETDFWKMRHEMELDHDYSMRRVDIFEDFPCESCQKEFPIKKTKCVLGKVLCRDCCRKECPLSIHTVDSYSNEKIIEKSSAKLSSILGVTAVEGLLMFEKDSSSIGGKNEGVDQKGRKPCDVFSICNEPMCSCFFRRRFEKIYGERVFGTLFFVAKISSKQILQCPDDKCNKMKFPLSQFNLHFVHYHVSSIVPPSSGSQRMVMKIPEVPNGTKHWIVSIHINKGHTYYLLARFNPNCPDRVYLAIILVNFNTRVACEGRIRLSFNKVISRTTKESDGFVKKKGISLYVQPPNVDFFMIPAREVTTIYLEDLENCSRKRKIDGRLSKTYVLNLDFLPGDDFPGEDSTWNERNTWKDFDEVLHFDEPDIVVVD